MKSIFTCYTALLVLVTFNLKAQDDWEKEKINQPFQVTFFTPLGTNGVNSTRFANIFSLNIIAGVNGGVDGFELGGIVNIDEGYVKGVQVSGFGNIVSGPVDAVQIAGFGNINSGYTEGLQGAGFVNIVGDSAKAFQIAGFGNVSAGLEGAQVSGFGNLSEKVVGFQGTGFMNIAKETNGAQAAGFMNIAEDLDGVQIAGFLNVANKVKGLQLAGFINICDSIDGIPIAPISIVRKGGYRRFEFWGNETFFLNTSFKIGIKDFYTVFTLGHKPGFSEFQWGFGFGAGKTIQTGEKNSLDLEAHVYNVYTDLWRSWEYNQLNQLRVSFNYQIAEHFSIFAGPTFNILISEYADSAEKISPSWSWKISRRNKVRGWFGFNLGFRF